MPDDLEAIRDISNILEPFTHEDQSRIIRWVSERLGIALPSAHSPPSQVRLGSDPRRALRDLLVRGDMEGIKAALPELEKLGSNDALLSAASILAAGGDEHGSQLLLRIVKQGELDDEHSKAAIGALAQYFILRDQESVGLTTLEPIMRERIASATSKEVAAFYYNQLGRLLYGAKRFQEAAEAQKSAADANPSEAAYAYNLSLVFERLGNLEQAVAYARRAIKDTEDVDHIAHAAELFAQCGLKADAREAIELLRRSDPARAEYLTRTDAAVRQLAR